MRDWRNERKGREERDKREIGWTHPGTLASEKLSRLSRYSGSLRSHYFPFFNVLIKAPIMALTLSIFSLNSLELI